MSEYEFVDIQNRGVVRRITLNSPGNRNALSVRLLKELHAAITIAAADPAVIVVEITGAGTIFSSGADLTEAVAEGGAPPGSAVMAEVLGTLMRFPKPTVCRVNGPARAGGIGLVAACDMAFSPRSATFAFPETQLGVIPALISVPLLRIMQTRSVRRYLLTGEVLDAEEAANAGIITAAFEDDEFGARVDEVIDHLVGADSDALFRTKALLAEPEGSGDPGPQLQAMRELSEHMFGMPSARSLVSARIVATSR